MTSFSMSWQVKSIPRVRLEYSIRFLKLESRIGLTVSLARTPVIPTADTILIPISIITPPNNNDDNNSIERVTKLVLLDYYNGNREKLSL